MKRIEREMPAPAPEPLNPDPTRVLVREVPAPGEKAELEEASFEDPLSIAAARKSRRGGYLKLSLRAVQALGKSAVLLEKVVSGTDLILRIRLFPMQAAARGR
ncbi:MAG: hypothetical protein ABIT01_05480 [Thermoanaerobaculia bacterium]